MSQEAVRIFRTAPAEVSGRVQFLDRAKGLDVPRQVIAVVKIDACLRQVETRGIILQSKSDVRTNYFLRKTLDTTTSFVDSAENKSCRESGTRISGRPPGG